MHYATTALVFALTFGVLGFRANAAEVRLKHCEAAVAFADIYHYDDVRVTYVEDFTEAFCKFSVNGAVPVAANAALVERVQYADQQWRAYTEALFRKTAFTEPDIVENVMIPLAFSSVADNQRVTEIITSALRAKAEFVVTCWNLYVNFETFGDKSSDGLLECSSFYPAGRDIPTFVLEGSTSGARFGLFLPGFTPPPG